MSGIDALFIGPARQVLLSLLGVLVSAHRERRCCAVRFHGIRAAVLHSHQVA